jgi:hypothetical protein
MQPRLHDCWVERVLKASSGVHVGSNTVLTREGCGRQRTMHSAECEDGMPPEAMSCSRSHLPFLILYVNTLAACATSHA